MTPDEAQRINALTTRMTTRCVGRYLIDLPEAFVLNDQSRTQIQGVEITAEPLKRFEFDRRLSARMAVLKSETIFGQQSPSLTATHELPDKSGVIFNRSESREDASSRALELLAWRNGYGHFMTIDALDMSLARRRYTNDPRQTDTPQKLAHLLELYARTQGRRDDEIPTEQGVCFANGFVRGASTEQEWIDMHHHWNEVPDVYVSYHFMTHIGPQDPPLLGRGSTIEANLAKFNGQTVRKGERDVHGAQLQEWLLYRDSQTKSRIYDYTLELNAAFGNADKPFLALDLVSGVRHPRLTRTLEQAAVEKPIAQASLGKAQSTALWDKVTSTLRPRPGAF
jgi:hypothetical protein